MALITLRYSGHIKARGAVIRAVSRRISSAYYNRIVGISYLTNIFLSNALFNILLYHILFAKEIENFVATDVGYLLIFRIAALLI